jgi:GNAT superfamily N-acetyltransferase
MVTIRAATAEDASAIAHVHVESWKSTYTGIVPDAYLAGLDEVLRSKLWHEFLTGGALILVAELDGTVAGFAHGGTNREGTEQCDAELYSIYLLRRSQGRGTGTALLKAMAGALVDRGFGGMAVWVLERNPSRLFYEKTGAHLETTKVIDIGGAKLMEARYVWNDLKRLAQLH